jgi:hypothetical protein
MVTPRRSGPVAGFAACRGGICEAMFSALHRRLRARGPETRTGLPQAARTVPAACCAPAGEWRHCYADGAAGASTECVVREPMKPRLRIARHSWRSNCQASSLRKYTPNRQRGQAMYRDSNNWPQLALSRRHAMAYGRRPPFNSFPQSGLLTMRSLHCSAQRTSRGISGAKFFNPCGRRKQCTEHTLCCNSRVDCSGTALGNGR